MAKQYMFDFSHFFCNHPVYRFGPYAVRRGLENWTVRRKWIKRWKRKQNERNGENGGRRRREKYKIRIER
jgi:hypothetical protein